MDEEREKERERERGTEERGTEEREREREGNAIIIMGVEEQIKRLFIRTVNNPDRSLECVHYSVFCYVYCCNSPKHWHRKIPFIFAHSLHPVCISLLVFCTRSRLLIATRPSGVECSISHHLSLIN